MTRYLHGLHDPGGEHLFGDKPGWVVISEAIGSDRNDHTGGDYRSLSDPGHGVLVRLNYAHNGVDGTVPTLDRALDFAARAAAYVAASAGCMRWIIGNEPNHEAERPHGEVITPEDYATVFNLCADHIHDALPSQAVILAAVAPWTAATE